MSALKNDSEWLKPEYPHFSLSDDGLIYYEDWDGRMRLCVPESLRLGIMDETHNNLTDGAHCGYHKCYNKISSTYYWTLEYNEHRLALLFVPIDLSSVHQTRDIE